MRDCDASVLVHDLGEHLGEGIDRVLDRTAKVSAMQVTVRASDLHLPVGKSAQARGDRRGILADHRSITHEDDIAGKQIAVLLEECLEAWAADLLFALEDELDAAVHQSFAHKVLKGLDLNHGLSLVVVCATRIKATIANRWFPWIGLPQVEWFDWHHVVVGIDEYGRYRILGIGRFAIGYWIILGIDEGITLGWHDLGMLCTCLKQ